MVELNLFSEFLSQGWCRFKSLSQFLRFLPLFEICIQRVGVFGVAPALGPPDWGYRFVGGGEGKRSSVEQNLGVPYENEHVQGQQRRN